MAISYDDAYNKEIARVVRNFNRKRDRAIKKGKRLVPPRVTVSDLKLRYETRKSLNRELRLLEKFGKRDALTEVENLGGAKAIKWEVEYLRSNLKYAKKFFDREIRKASQIDSSMAVTRKEYLDNLRAKRSILDLEMAELNPADFRTFERTMDDYFYANQRNVQDYRNFLKEVEVIMRHMGYDNKTINKFFEGFDSLTPEQFIMMYRENNIISRVYELYIPSRDGGFKLSTSEEDAKDLIDTLMKEKDQMIERAKSSIDMSDTSELDEFARDVNKTKIPKEYDSHAAIAGATPKANKNKYSKKDISDLKALGWYDDVVGK